MRAAQHAAAAAGMTEEAARAADADADERLPAAIEAAIRAKAVADKTRANYEESKEDYKKEHARVERMIESFEKDNERWFVVT